MLHRSHKETKMTISSSHVLLRLHSSSAKASTILKHLSEPFFFEEIQTDYSLGLTYFYRFESPHLVPSRSRTQGQEVIAFCPQWLLITQASPTGLQTTHYHRSAQGTLQPHQAQSTDDFLTQLRALHRADHEEANSPYPAQNVFTGGLAGFIGYDLTANHAVTPLTTPTQLLAAMGQYDIFLKNEENDWVLYGPDDPNLARLYQQIKLKLEHVTAAIDEPAELPPTNTPSGFEVLKPFQPIWSKQDYCSAFDRIQSYLYAGDCYQVNLTQPFVAEVSGRLLDTLDDLLTLTQPPYGGYMRVGGHELLSCSPELFLAFTGRDHSEPNTVITRPIKGTFPRSENRLTDAANKTKLFDSEKDQSENLMIVDLLRNDLSRHAVVGSVKVPVLFEIESFAQVHHLVSEVRAQLAAGTSPLDVLIDALPGGSITGAPKKRAMEIIVELEARPRAAYCGSFGYLNHDGSGQFNILIRTLQKNHHELVAWAGGGITVASEVDAEYQECLDKIGAILDCIDQYALSKKS